MLDGRFGLLTIDFETATSERVQLSLRGCGPVGVVVFEQGLPTDTLIAAGVFDELQGGLGRF